MTETLAHEGWLLKWGVNPLSSSFKDRYFVLKGPQLYYFRERDQNEPNGIISMANVTDIAVNAEGPNPTVKAKGFGINIITPERTYYLAAKTVGEQRMWVTMMNKSKLSASKEVSSPRTKKRDFVPDPKFNISGFLRKRGAGNKAWKDRFVKIHDGVVHYYKAQEDASPVGEIQLIDVISVTKLEGTSGQTSKTFIGYEFSVTTRARVYYFLAKSKPDRLRWMNAMGNILDLRTNADRNESDVVKEGHLLKRNPGNTISVWKDRFVVLKKDKLLYYKSADDRESLGCIPFHKILKVDVPSEPLESGAREFESSFVIETNSRSYIFATNSADERRAWITAFKDSLSDYEKTEKRQSRCESMSNWTIEKMTGMLLKRGPSHNSAYRERWFVVEENCLKYYKSSLCQPEELAGSIPFADISYVHLSEITQGIPKANAEGAFMIDTDYRAYYLAARNREEARQWVNVLERCRSLYVSEVASPSIPIQKTSQIQIAQPQASRSLQSSAAGSFVFEQPFDDEEDDTELDSAILLEGPANVLVEGEWKPKWIRLEESCMKFYDSKMSAKGGQTPELLNRPDITSITAPSTEDKAGLTASQGEGIKNLEHCIVIQQDAKRTWVDFKNHVAQSSWMEQLTAASIPSQQKEELAEEVQPQRSVVLPQLQGNLSKLREGPFQIYQERWFSIKGDSLYYFKKKTDANPVGKIPLQSITYVHPAEALSQSAKKDGCPFVIDTTLRTYQLLAPSIVEMSRWIKGLSAYHDYYHPSEPATPK